MWLNRIDAPFRDAYRSRTFDRNARARSKSTQRNLVSQAARAQPELNARGIALLAVGGVVLAIAAHLLGNSPGNQLTLEGCSSTFPTMSPSKGSPDEVFSSAGDEP